MTGDAIVVDTSVAVPFLLSSHVEHSRVRSFLRGLPLVLSAHSLAETYSVLTRLPGDARVAADDAVALLDADFRVVTPSASEQESAHRLLAAAGIAGGAVYDGLVAIAARSAGMPLATHDRRALGTYAALGVRVLLVT